MNDTEEDILELTSLLKHRNCHVNLIPVNPVREKNFRRPDKKLHCFFKINLKKMGLMLL